MSEEQNNYINILKDIFHCSNDNSSEIYPILKDSDNIKKFKEYIKNKDANNKNKIFLLKQLKIIFEQNDILIPFFINNCYKKPYYFFYPIINLFLTDDIDEENLNFLEEFLLLINSHISLNKQILEFIYQKLSKFFGNRSKTNLNEAQFIKYLHLLKIFYKDISINENIDNNENNNNIIEEKKQKQQKKIKNYIFFNGFNSCLTFSENNNPMNGNISFPTLENGVSIIFWFYFDKNLFNNYYKIYPNIEINLIIITIEKNIIKLIFKESRYLIVKINEEESKELDIFSFLKEDGWNFMGFVINSKDKKLNRIYINNSSLEYNLSIKGFPMFLKIDNIKLFQNFLGKITSILFFSFPLEQKMINQLISQLGYLLYGFYSNRILFRFLLSHDNNYFKNSIHYKYLSKYQDEKLSEKFLKIESTDKNKNNIINLFCPFAYIKESNQLDDIFGNYIGNLSKNDGVIFYVKYTKNIMQMDDLNSLLPISELMYSSLKGTPNPSYTQVEKGLLSEKTIFEYLNIIKEILFHHNQNINYLNSNDFFGNLSLFLERYPSEIFTEKILNILIDIGIEILKYDLDNKEPNDEHYINCILLNEKILYKFNGENQNKLWKQLFQFFSTDYKKLGYYLNIQKICHLIRFYDRKRYEEYCCSNHASLFSKTTNKNNKNIKIKGNMKIMEPEMDAKLEYFFNTIQLYLDKIIKYNKNYNINNSNSNDPIKEINLYQLLVLDLSPCIQKKIIQVYINHFLASDQNVPEINKIETVNNLLYNNFIEITEYVLSVSLLDTRTLLLTLFRIIIGNYLYIFISFYMKMNSNNSNRLINIVLFLGDNLFPDKLCLNIDYNISQDDNKIYKNSSIKLSIDKEKDINIIKKRSNSLTKKNNKLDKKIKFIFGRFSKDINLINYFNKEIYQKEVESFNLCLINFVEQLCNNTKEINPFIIYMLTTFSKKLSISYIEMLSYYLFSNFQDKNPPGAEAKTKTKKSKIFKKVNIKENNNINDKLMLSEKEIIYKWLIDTIFFFNNSENLNNFSKNDNELILKIQTSTLELFKIYFYGNKPKKEINARIKYLFDYLYYMKNSYKNKKEKLKEFEKIARNLIRIILEFSDEDINMKALISFEFLFLLQNSEKLFNINYGNNNYSIENILFGSISEKNLSLKNEQNMMNQEKNIINQKNEVNENKINNEIKLSNEDETENELISKNAPKKEKEFLEPKDFIPNYIFEGLYLTETLTVEDDNQINTEIKEEKQYEKSWSDFFICNYLLDSYQLKFWGTQHICEKVKLPTDSYWIDISNLLLEKYGYKSYKKNQNILMEEILILFNWPNEKSDENDIEDYKDNKKKRDSKEVSQNSSNDIKIDLSKKTQNSINILNINLILLSIITLLKINDDEKEFYIRQYQKFLLFCILASINISSSAKNYEVIQNILYNILGYGFSFLKVISEDKYNELIKYIIMPIIDEINNEFFKIKFNKIFGIQNKLLYRHSAVFKLFVSGNEKPKEKEKGEEIEKEKGKETLKKDEKEIGIKKEKENIEDKKEDNKNKNPKDTKKNNNKIKVYFDFHGVDINKLINEIFITTLDKYKNFRENNSITNIIRYYEDDENNNMNYTKLIEEKNIMTKIIKELIPFIESQINENSDLSDYKEKKRKYNYKKLKAKLFSWRGFWSDRNLFFNHPDYLKVKIKNFFTKEMFKPLLSPILDVKYYLPDFSQFDKNNLFNYENFKYYINLNINEILGKNNSNEQIYENSHNKTLINSNNTLEFNYLKSLYKHNYEEIWKLYNHKKQDSPFSSLEKQKLDIISNYIKKEIKIKLKNNINDNKNINKEIPRNSIKSENQIISKEIKYMNCCFIKSSHHIKGKIIAEKNYFIFLPEDYKYKTEKMIKEENDNDNNFDKISGCCYGAYFKQFPKDKDSIGYVLKYSKIKYIFLRVYYYIESALEIYTFSNKNYYINFSTKKDMNELLTTILCNSTDFNPIKIENKRTLGYIQMKNTKDKKKIYNIINKSEDWQNYRISTLEYLMWLNIYGGRSFNDITQYPVVPWILMDYESNELTNIKRDFSLPVGMFSIDKWILSTQRKEGYLELFQNSLNEFENNNPHFNMKTYLEKGEEYYHSYNNKILKMKSKEEKKNSESKGDHDSSSDEDEYNEIKVNQIPYIFGSHFSNPFYTSHFLVRIFPFSFISIQIHGTKFDDPSRMFFSVSKTFQCVCTLKEDLRELIPEFYSLPEVFLNCNKLKLAEEKQNIDGELLNINDVFLPPWCENNPSIFVSKMRNFMENNTENINKWIDLIFGFNQRGENAQINNNIFLAQTYEKMVKIEEVTDPNFREGLMRLIEMGVTPFKIFFNESKERINKNEFIKKNPIYCCSKGTFLDVFKKLDALSLFSDMYISLSEKLDLSVNKDGSESPIKILSIKPIHNVARSSILIFTSSNHWYEIKYNISKAEIIKEEKQIHIIKNNSSKYSSSYIMSHLKSIPFVVYGNCKYILKGGFLDGRIEFNSINLAQSNKYISKCIFSNYSQPIIIMKISSDEKYLFCGTNSGLIIIYKVAGPDIKLKKYIIHHSDEITDISVNSLLNMFASVSKDGYLFLYILPSFKMVRAIKISNNHHKNRLSKNLEKENSDILNKNDNKNKEKINNIEEKINIDKEESKDINIGLNIKNEIKIEDNGKGGNENERIISEKENNEIEEEDEEKEEDSEQIYVDNVFLSSSPLPCVTIYISKFQIFRTYTINGEFVSEQKEEDELGSKYIKSPKIFKNLTLEDFLIYGTDKGYVKVRSFPDMKLIGEKFDATHGIPIETLEISEDKRFCFVWSKGNLINIIKDIGVSTVQTAENISGMGFHI